MHLIPLLWTHAQPDYGNCRFRQLRQLDPNSIWYQQLAGHSADRDADNSVRTNELCLSRSIRSLENTPSAQAGSSLSVRGGLDSCVEFHR